MHKTISGAAGSLRQLQAERSALSGVSGGPLALTTREPAARSHILTRRPTTAPALHGIRDSRRGYALRTSHDRDEPRFSRSSSSRIAPQRERASSGQPDGRADKTDSGDAQPIVSQELVAPVQVPEDSEGVLSKESDPHIADVLAQSALVVTRELEMMNVFLGFEQANRYALLSPTGQPTGYLAEQEVGLLGGSVQRQLMRTHRPFTATLLSTSGQPLLLFKRGFTLINSTVQVFRLDPDWDGTGFGAKANQSEGAGGGMRLIGETQQKWHPWRRKYDLFLNRQQVEDGPPDFEQFARIDTGLLGWDFMMQDKDDKLIGAINRNFRGFGRELFTDTGQYVLRFDSVAQDELLAPRIAPAVEPGQPLQTGRDLVESEQSTRALTLDERAVALATAVSVDFDYFSRHSRGGSGGMFPFIWWGGSSPREAEAGAEGQPPVTGEGQDSRGVMGTPEAPGTDSGVGTAAGTAAGYGMMGGGGGYQDAQPPQDAGASPPPQGDFGGWDSQQSPSPSGQDPWAQSPPDGSWSAGPDRGVGGEDVWGSSEPWSQEAPSGGEGGGGLFQGLWDIFGGDE